MARGPGRLDKSPGQRRGRGYPNSLSPVFPSFPGARRCARVRVCHPERGVSAPSAHTLSFRDAGLEQPIEQSKYFLSAALKLLDVGPLARTQSFARPPARGVASAYSRPGLHSTAGKQRPLWDSLETKPAGSAGQTTVPVKSIKSLRCLTLPGQAREQKHFFSTGFLKKQRVKSTADHC